MSSTRHFSWIVLLGGLSLAAACGDDSGANGDGGDPFDGQNPIVDADTTGLTDGAIVNDAGVWLCPTNVGQFLPCQCNDGVDNDADGQTDFPNDPACAGPSDNLEDAALTVGDTQCTNQTDDDTDGLIDSQDPECTGPLDDDESSFATGIPGDNMDECHQDCWFDGDSGSGNDGCRWLLGCDPVAGAAYDCNLLDPASNNCTRQQTDACINFCRPYTPNGCDCFGCCDIYVDGTLYTILLAEQCSTDDIRAGSIQPDDPNGECVRCTKTDTCINPCDPCEYCIGHEPEPGCFTGADGGLATPDGGGCAAGQTVCDPTDPDGGGCAADEFCLTGCCVSAID